MFVLAYTYVSTAFIGFYYPCPQLLITAQISFNLLIKSQSFFFNGNLVNCKDFNSHYKNF